MSENNNRKKWKLTIVFMIIFGSLLFNSCTKSKAADETSNEKKMYVSENNVVETIVLKNESFRKELVSNGKIIATQKNTIQFEVSDKLEQLYVKNGDFVHKGQLLATLNSFKYQQRLAMAEIELKKAKFQFADMLVGRGIFTTQKDSIPRATYDMVASRTGYDAALIELKTAQFELESTRLIAPFSGKVANIESKIHENVSAGKSFLTLIDDSTFEVEFYLIESEMVDIALNSSVQIIPLALGKTYNGHISSINPLIEKNGTILVKAIVKNDRKLTEGMNVKVLIGKEVKGQLVVPKSAVLIRDNQEVLFKVISGKAYWTYIKTTLENSSSYAVIADPDKSSAILNSGDTIIVSGNLNLAHDSEVVLSTDKSN
ncbi:efflux RND transporter periplasmic adaptor subunit [Flavobacterium sp. LHD-85]|uniref:efflux RND transporter periplasmic adaptor subunit n=1 Tax=Flavobacterium sp. LHD-85 TaxID=3071410 RepID=UPI0027DF2850|nr:efflux RND transporter periplasmic adaptor subunit [Flavobacterium sp. LHD-85]MDQ6527680.1 efflux RND transporter periplasmic adaptor subunit [Flavobacterium sp. LHD-85]